MSGLKHRRRRDRGRRQHRLIQLPRVCGQIGLVPRVEYETTYAAQPSPSSLLSGSWKPPSNPAVDSDSAECPAWSGVELGRDLKQPLRRGYGKVGALGKVPRTLHGCTHWAGHFENPWSTDWNHRGGLEHHDGPPHPGPPGGRRGPAHRDAGEVQGSDCEAVRPQRTWG